MYLGIWDRHIFLDKNRYERQRSTEQTHVLYLGWSAFSIENGSYRLRCLQRSDTGKRLVTNVRFPFHKITKYIFLSVMVD